MNGKSPSSPYSDHYIIDIRKVFLAVLLLGILGIVIPQALGFNQLSVVLPLLLMTTYTAIGYRRSKDSPFLEQFADSVYYLGFLFTLVGLVVSLYYYRSEDLEIASVIVNFSLALTTTIFGLAVRIYINNFQVDLRSAERQMMEGVEHACGEFIRKSKTLSMQLELAHDETQRSIRRAVEDAATAIAQAGTEIENHAQTSSQALLEHLTTINSTVEGSVKTLEQKIKNAELPHDIFARRLTPSITALTDKLHQTQQVVTALTQEQTLIKDGYRNMTRELDHLSSALTASGRTLEAFNKNLAAHNLASEDFLQLVERIGQLTQAADKMMVSVTVQSEHATMVLERFDALINRLQTLPKISEQAGQKLRGTVDEMIELFASIATHSHQGIQIGQDLEAIAEALNKSRETVTHISEFGMHVTSAYKRLETFNNALERHSLTLFALGKLAGGDIELIKQHQREIADLMEQSRAAMASFNRQVTGLPTNQHPKQKG